MRFRFSVSLRAHRQIHVAAKWLAENRPAAPALLREELESAYAVIAELPFAGEPVPHSRITGLRRLLLGRTDTEGVIELLALWHTSRGKRPPL